MTSRLGRTVGAGVLAVAIVVNTVVMWSDAVGAWWADRLAGGGDGDGSLPAPLRWLVEARPDVGDADLHALAWAVPALLAALVVVPRRGPVPRASGLVVAAVWAWSVTVEALQPVVSETRAFEWIDVVGNTVGVVGGGSLGWWLRRRAIDRPVVRVDRDRTKAPGVTRP